MITEPPPRLDQFGDAEPAAEKRAVEVELDRPPEFVERGVDRGLVLRGRAAGIVVEHVEPAEFVDGRADRRLEAVGVGDVSADRDRPVAGEMRGLLARGGIDIGDRDPGAFARKQDRRGAADPGTGASDEGYLACEPRHRFLLPVTTQKQPEAGGPPYDIVPASHARENAMTDTRPFDPALFGDAAIDADTAKLNAQMIQLLTGQPEWWIAGAAGCGPRAAAARGRFPPR